MNEQAAVVKQGRGAKFWIILALVIVLVMTGTGVGVYFLVRGQSANAEETKPLPVYQMSLKPFTVNLADSNFRRYLRVQITIEANEKKVLAELDTMEYRVRDTIITLLMGKRVSDLEGQEQLRQEVTAAINNLLAEDKITGVYFEDFIIQ